MLHIVHEWQEKFTKCTLMLVVFSCIIRDIEAENEWQKSEKPK